MKRAPDPISYDPWLLDSDITYLNHGSFGARLRAVHEAQEAFTLQFEASPVDFLDRNRSLLADARQTVSSFLGADPDGFGFVDNATTAVSCVVRSAGLQQGDEILTTDHVYNGVRQLLHHHAEITGCTYRELPLTLPLESSATIVRTIKEALHPTTKLLVIDHVASTSSVVFPVHHIVKFCQENNILVLIDGAHAPGMLDLDIESIGADWYVGNLHKWVCAPLGAGFVVTAMQHRSATHPLTVSHNLGQSYTSEFDWQGTKDITPWLSAAVAVQRGDEIGWDRIRAHNHAFATWMQARLVQEWGVEPLTPLNGDLIGNMATVLLPDGFSHEMEPCIALRDTLFMDYRIEVPIFAFQGRGVLRVSAQLYSRESDLQRLLHAICEQNTTQFG